MARSVRTATVDDAASCARLYAPYVTETAITFETEVPTVQAMAARIDQANRLHAWLVLEEDGEVVGYAYAGPFHPRAAYRWSCEVSVYLDLDRRGRGAGRALYDVLLQRLRERGYRRAIALIALPNEPSLRLHRGYGFADAGTHRRVGWKHGAWQDVTWLDLDLAPAASDPPAEIE